MIYLSHELIEAGAKDWQFNDVMQMQGENFRVMPGRRTFRFQLASARYFAKVHSGVGWREIFKQLCQLKWPVFGAENEWCAILRLQQLDISTLTLVAYGKQGFNPAAMQSFVITQALENTCSLKSLCLDWQRKAPNGAFKRSLIRKIAQISATLHNNGINHRDYYLIHFLISQQQADRSQQKHWHKEALQLYLIDLHRVQIRQRTPKRWIIKDLSGLYFSAMDMGLSNRDLLLFIRHYRDPLLKQHPEFWRAVAKRALALYRKIHGKEPN